MTRHLLPAAALGLGLLAAGPVLASNGGDRAAAGGAFMSSYSSGPYNSSNRAAPAWNPDREPAATGSVVSRRRGSIRR